MFICATGQDKHEQKVYIAIEWIFIGNIYTYRNSSFADNVHTPPHDVFDRKSTGLVTCGLIGNRKKKSNSADVISSFINKICT